MAAEKTPWWIAEGLDLRNGIFQGGGAKGLAYVGALCAFRENGSWFGAAAGSSAGAITATMVAAGLKPEEMRGLTTDALASIKRPSLRQFGAWASMWSGHLFGLFGFSGPIFPTGRLRVWIEDRLREQYMRFTGDPWSDVRSPWVGHEDVTFAALAQATGIDLFIVALDITSGVPIVLSRYSAPDCQVSWATVASSSMPLFMDKQRLLVADEHFWSTAELVDGGAWANYPRFVFDDESFARYNRIPDEVRSRETVGFILKPMPAERAEAYLSPPYLGHFGSLPREASGWRDPLSVQDGGSFVTTSDEGPQTPAAPKRRRQRLVNLLLFVFLSAAGAAAIVGGWNTQPWLLGLGITGAAAIAYVLRGKLLRGLVRLASKGVRVDAMRMAGIAFVLFLLASGILAIPVTLPALVDAIPGGWALPSIVAGWAVLATVCVIAGVVLALAAALFFHGFFAHDAPRIANAVLGAATRVPAWVGVHPSEFVLRVPVDPSIDTTAFTVDPKVADRVIDNAYASTKRQLEFRASGGTVELTEHAPPSRWPNDLEVGQLHTGMKDPMAASRKDTLLVLRTLVGFWGYFIAIFAGLYIGTRPAVGESVGLGAWIALAVGVAGIALWLVLRIYLRGFQEGGGPIENVNHFVRPQTDAETASPGDRG